MCKCDRCNWDAPAFGMYDHLTGPVYIDQKQTFSKEERLVTLIAELYDLPKEAICLEFLDVFKVVKKGSEKRPMNNWLNKDGDTMDKKSNYKSIMFHSAQASTGLDATRWDESGLQHKLHAACRLLMDHTREERGITHTKDEEK